MFWGLYWGSPILGNYHTPIAGATGSGPLRVVVFVEEVGFLSCTAAPGGKLRYADAMNSCSPFGANVEPPPPQYQIFPIYLKYGTKRRSDTSGVGGL